MESRALGKIFSSLPSILETKSFNSSLKHGKLKIHFKEIKRLVICSYQFARNKSEYAGQIKWDLIVIDEAHRLRNVYKPTNKIARTLRETFKACAKSAIDSDTFAKFSYGALWSHKFCG